MRMSLARNGRRPFRVAAVAALAAAVTVAATGMPALAAGTYVLSTSQVAAAGGTVVYLTGTGSNFTAQGVRFITPATATCPTTYANASATSGATTVSAGLLGVIDATDAYITVPAVAAGSTYAVCLYADASSGAAYNTDTTTGTLTGVNTGMLSAVTGQAADKVTLTFPTAVLTGTTYATQFVSGQTACPTTYSTVSSTAVVSTTAKTSTTVLTVTVPTLTSGTAYLICSYAGTSVSSSALLVRGATTFASYSSTLPTLTLNPTGGSSGTSTSVTATASSAAFTGTPAALLSRNSCPATYVAGTTPLEPYAATSTTKISTTKVAITVPNTVIVGGLDVTTAYNVCLYASSSAGALIAAPTTYTVAPILSVSGAQFAAGSASPANTGSGPAQGGQTITITGLTGIPTAAAVTAGAKLTAALGGSALNNIVPIDATSFSAVTTSHAAGQVTLSVSTAAGMKSTTIAGGHYYTYTYGITVSPNTSPTATAPVLDITGAGFSSLTFADITTGTALAAGNAYVLLTNNTWNAQTFATATNAQALAAVSYCNTVLPISDTEIICNLALANSISAVTSNAPTIAVGTGVANGTYTVTVVNAGTNLLATSYNYSIVSSGSTFTVSGY